MTHSKIEIENVDIYQYPSVNITNASQLTLGDVHANAMFLIHFLTMNGVVKISEENYARLKDIYLKSELKKDDVQNFNNIIDELEAGEKPLIRLIGDEICDRGQNDYFIFVILDKLRKINIPFEVLLSNHGINFLIPYEQNRRLFSSLGNNFTRSMSNMCNLMEQKIISKKDIDSLVNKSYLPNLRLISYSLHNKSITIYSHAGIGIETIQALAKKFNAHGVVYKDDTLKNLAQTIDAINLVFQKHIRERKAHTLVVDMANPYDYQGDPVTFLIWNRAYHRIKRDRYYKDYEMFFAHGHDLGEQTQNNIFNLDNPSFKETSVSIGSYVALGSQCDSVAALKMGAGVPIAPENHFYGELVKLLAKAHTLEINGHIDAYFKAMDIYTTLNEAYNTLQKDRNYPNYKKTCAEVIAKNRFELDKHRGWSEFLFNLAIAIPTFGVGLLLKGGYNLTQKRLFFFVHKTESGKIVDEIQNKLDSFSTNIFHP